MGAAPAALPLPRRIPLTGADCFLRAFDHEVRRYHRASHVSQLVLRLGPGFRLGAFRELVGRVAEAQPILAARIRRPLGLAAPCYELPKPGRGPAIPVERHRLPGPAPAPGAPPPRLLASRLNQPMRAERGPLLRFDAVQYGDGETDLAASWLHMLFDGHGSEVFVQWLADCLEGRADPGALPLREEFAPPPPPRQTARERGDLAWAWEAWLRELGGGRARSLAGPITRTPQALEYQVLAFDRAQSQRIEQNAKARAGFLTPMLFYLAAAIRAHDAVFRKRGLDPGRYLVPLPVDLRPKGAEAAIFRSHVSLLWFGVEPRQVQDLDELCAELKRQRLAAIRAGQVQNGVYAMDFARFAPRRLYARMARRSLRGELCSFFFAYTGDFAPGLERFAGAPLRWGYHVAPVPPSPGSALALSFSGGRLHGTHVRQCGVFSADELAVFREQLASDLTRSPA